MKKEDLKLGDTIKMFNTEHYRIVAVYKNYLLVDSPEQRGYYTDGKLHYMPFKKIYFETRNMVWNIKNIQAVENDYQFKLQQFEEGPVSLIGIVVEPNILPTIKESLKLKAPNETWA